MAYGLPESTAKLSNLALVARLTVVATCTSVLLSRNFTLKRPVNNINYQILVLLRKKRSKFKVTGTD